MDTWGWTSYRREVARLQDGRRLYLGRFARERGTTGYERARLYFWARRPIAALRELTDRLNAGTDIARLHGRMFS